MPKLSKETQVTREILEHFEKDSKLQKVDAKVLHETYSISDKEHVIDKFDNLARYVDNPLRERFARDFIEVHTHGSVVSLNVKVNIRDMVKKGTTYPEIQLKLKQIDGVSAVLKTNFGFHIQLCCGVDVHSVSNIINSILK